MALMPCDSYVDASGREQVVHGSTGFPIACYHNDLNALPVPLHWHEELEAGVVTEGTAVISIGREKYRLHAGEGFFINSGVLHDACPADHTGCCIRSLVFHPLLVGGSADSVFYRRYLLPVLEDPTLEWLCFQPHQSWHRAACGAVSTAWKACAEESPGFEFSVRSSLSSLLWLLYSHRTSLRRQPSTKDVRDAERIKLMLSHIHRNFSSPITIRDIAAAANVGESECLRCFRSTVGITPIRYLKQYRLRQAAMQLLSTPDMVSQIAERCGFQDMSYFTKAFRETEGCTPSQYRQNRHLPREGVPE